MDFILPLDIFLHIFPYLSISDILSLRLTCKAFLEMTKSRSVWSVFYQSHVLQQDIPTPRLDEPGSLSHLSNTDLEGMTKRAILLRRNWSAPKPNPTSRWDVIPEQDNPMRVILLEFVRGHRSRWFISVHARNVYGSTLFLVRNWDVTSHPPQEVDRLTLRHFAGLAVNSAPGHPYTFAVQCPHLAIYSITSDGRFRCEREFPERNWKLLAFTTATLVSRPNDDDDAVIMNVDDPVVEARLSSPDHVQPEECHDALIDENFILILRATAIEIYDLTVFRKSSRIASESPLQPSQRLTLEPISRHKWPWRIDSGKMVPQISYESQQRRMLPPIYILARFGSWFPWPVNILHHYRLAPNRAYDESLDIGPQNLPYNLPPWNVQTIASPVRLFSTTDMALGSYGTALWIDTHTEEYFSPDSGQRLAAHTLNDVTPEDDPEMPQTSMASAVFDLNPGDTWVRLAMHEAEGRIAIGHATGEITFFDYVDE
ncbi:hypothetical protein ONZ45_g13665 [Pleurotus djamor]|nr:hypothetical protein ONZ45_g13665 [Pleurotus djamor]